MGVGIGATLVNISNGTTANAPDVLTSLTDLNNAGVSNDGGTISTNGAGVITMLGAIVNGPIQPNVASVTPLSGGTSGTATLYQFFQGTYKYTMIILSNFRTGGAAQTIVLPVPYTVGGFIRTGNSGTSTANAGVALLASGAAITVYVATALAAGGGTSASNTEVDALSFGSFQNGFDTVQFQASGTAGHYAVIIIEGV